MCELPQELWEPVDAEVVELFKRSDAEIHSLFNRILSDIIVVDSEE